jgi:hypothetical protein
LNEVEARTELEVWPVPAGSVVNVQVGPDAREVVLTDLEGRVVKTTATQRDITSIDVSALARGMYMVRVRMVNGTVRRAKVILE